MVGVENNFIVKLWSKLEFSSCIWTKVNNCETKISFHWELENSFLGKYFPVEIIRKHSKVTEAPKKLLSFKIHHSVFVCANLLGTRGGGKTG